ncbi:MAG TPA: GerMN domain-containing protein [Pyrinomonadaceae bacterium]|jgi:hypothetical protein|nr:GerMN domain-containing protein [Pyrinomonadaceae bacterium]
MKIVKIISISVVMLAGLSFSAVFSQGSKASKPMSPQALVADLYKQHKKRSPFFQTRNRALLDKYFDRKLANLLWQDAHSSGDEVGALDGDPLFNAQDMEIKNFSIHEGTGGPRMREVPVTFENFGQPHKVLFRLFATGGTWKIANIEYDDGSSLVEILKSDQGPARNTQHIKIYLVALGDNGKTGKKIGCDDSLIAVTRDIKKTTSPLTAAIGELLLTPQHPEGSPNLENFWKGKNLKVRSVSLVNGTATIQLSGEVFVAGVCDEPRIQSQIEATARQFPTVKNVRVFLGKQTLADAIR